MKKTNTTNRKSGTLKLFALALAAGAAFLAGTAQAATLTWGLVGDGAWDTSTPNWTGDATTFISDNTQNVIFDNTAGGTITIDFGMSPLSTTVSAISGTYTFIGGPIAGTGSLTKNGAGMLILSGTSTYSGDTAVNGGTLVANGSSAVADTPSFTVAGGATLLLSGSLAGVGGGANAWPAASVNGAGTVSLPLDHNANVGLKFDMSAFTGSLDITNGMMAVSPYYSPSFLSPTNGTIIVENNTTLYLGWSGFSLNTTVQLNGGTDNGEGYGVLRGDNATLYGAVILGANSTIGCAGGTFTINAVISDGAHGYGITQVQNGTVVLTATNTYSGPTIVSAGTLQCNNPGALGNGGTLSISTGAKVNLNYSGEHAVAAVTLGGVPQTGGTYGSTASGADHTNNTYFAGTGVVRVPASSLKNMLTFSFGALGSATIIGTNITMLVPGGTDVTHLAPTYTVSPGTTGSPVSGTTNNFTLPQVYTVTAEDSSTQNYLVTVTQGVLANLFAWTNTASGTWSVAANWTNDVGNLQTPLAGGRSSYTLNFNAAGTYTASNDLYNGFVLNQLNLGGPTLTLAGNGLAFAANGATLPQISQNSAAACTINGSLNLATNTTVGGSGAGQVNLASVISGAGSLTKSTPGVLKIYGLVPNTYSGGTIISSGTLWVGTMVGTVSPLCTGVLGTGPVTLGNGTTIEFDRVTASNALISNGGTLYSQNGWGTTWSGPITLNANTTFNAQYPLSCSGAISGTGGLIKTNGGLLILSGTNTYTGPTTVTGGTLECDNMNALGAGGLSIGSGATVNLNYTGTRIVTSLTLEETVMPPGTYGSSGSGWGDDVHFVAAGTGTVTVVAPPLVLPIITWDGTTPTFNLATSVVGSTCKLVYKNELPDETWQDTPAPDGQAAGGGAITLRDSSSPLPSHRFYKLVVTTP